MLALYKKLFYDLADPRSLKYGFLNSPISVFGLAAFYVLFIFKLGPMMMKGRAPFQISTIIKYYNLLQVVLNCMGLYLGTQLLFKSNIFCIPIDYSDSSDSQWLVLLHYLYFLLKAIDLLDTVFFILRKKFTHVTFLHCYHHSLMLVASWATFRYIPGGQLLVLGYVNVFVHIAMYFYYYLTCYDPVYKQSIWWKKHLTQLQLVQHCFLTFVFTVSLLDQTCSYPKIVLLAYIPQLFLMIYLFTEFYYKSYIKSRETVKTE